MLLESLHGIKLVRNLEGKIAYSLRYVCLHLINVVEAFSLLCTCCGSLIGQNRSKVDTKVLVNGDQDNPYISILTNLQLICANIKYMTDMIYSLFLHYKCIRYIL